MRVPFFVCLPVARAAPAGFRFAALALRLEAAELRGAARLRLAPPLRLVHRRDQHFPQPLHDGRAIALLGSTGFGREVDFVRLREPSPRCGAQARRGGGGNSLQRTDRHPELDLRIELVDVLPARAAAARGLEAQARFSGPYARRELDA